MDFSIFLSSRQSTISNNIQQYPVGSTGYGPIVVDGVWSATPRIFCWDISYCYGRCVGTRHGIGNGRNSLSQELPCMMRKSTFLVLGVVPLSARYSPDTAPAEWVAFKQKFGRVYGPEESEYRFKIFVNNLKIIDERNDAETGTATYGVNKFADLTPEEFAEYFLTAIPPTSTYVDPYSTYRHDVVKDVVKYNGTESLVDWTGIYTTPVKDQGYCGSCWAFSATEQIESDAMRQLAYTEPLSVNQMLQCTLKGGVPCRGGWTEAGYIYTIREGGLTTEAEYPYEDPHNNDCGASSRKEVVGVHRYTTILGEDNMAAYVKSTGPLSVCLSAGGWEFYQGGIVENCPKVVNHCVQAVGVDDSAIGGYWKVRNSYGPDWGESGFIRLAYGKNTCFITRDPTYVDTFKV